MSYIQLQAAPIETLGGYDVLMSPGLDGFIDDLGQRISQGIKTLTELLKLRTEHEIRVRVELPPSGEMLRRTLPSIIIGVVAIAGAWYATKRLMAPISCPTPR